MQDSDTIRFLKGKKVAGLPAPVAQVLKWGEKRVVVDAEGHRQTVTQERLKTMFNQAMAQYQYLDLRKTVHTRPDGTASVILGGREKGERKVYVSREAALQALNRRYNDAFSGKTNAIPQNAVIKRVPRST
jgi:hypothetical protein